MTASGATAHEAMVAREAAACEVGASLGVAAAALVLSPGGDDGPYHYQSKSNSCQN